MGLPKEKGNDFIWNGFIRPWFTSKDKAVAAIFGAKRNLTRLSLWLWIVSWTSVGLVEILFRLCGVHIGTDSSFLAAVSIVSVSFLPCLLIMPGARLAESKPLSWALYPIRLRDTVSMVSKVVLGYSIACSA